MEQIYMLEIMVEKISVFEPDEGSGGRNKKLTIKLAFGPKAELTLNEGEQETVEKETPEDIIDCDEHGRRRWSRTIRIGKSYTFRSCPDTVLLALNRFPLGIEVFDDDPSEKEPFIGIGSMTWDSRFFHMLKDTRDVRKIQKPLTLKQVTPLFAECCCKQVGELTMVLRVCALGNSIITEFQQSITNPHLFVFRTDKFPTMIKCQRVDGDDVNFLMLGTIYESVTLEDPTAKEERARKMQVCSDIHTCRDNDDSGVPCEHYSEDPENTKQYTLEKVRMGDICGPCGNVNCPLARKVKKYIRNLEAYKKAAKGLEGKCMSKKPVCGSCHCPDDTRDISDIEPMREKCNVCGPQGVKCGSDEKKSEPNTKGHKTHDVHYLTNTVTGQDYATDFENNYFVESFTTHHKWPVNQYDYKTQSGHSFIDEQHYENESHCNFDNFELRRTASCPSNKCMTSEPRFGPQNLFIYNVTDMKTNKHLCTDITDTNDCTCSPPKPTPLCKAKDCVCVTKAIDIDLRKRHKSYCPRFKHKPTCAVLAKTVKEEDDREDHVAEEDVTEPLPYGLPPVKLGPCPVLGKPCTYPDGFARMYKAAVLPPAQKSYDDAGKICCTTEFERIKKALKEYMTNDKKDDYRCINKFNVDTERRCCDKENKLLPLIGKACCGYHKMALQERYKSSGPKAGDKKQ